MESTLRIGDDWTLPPFANAIEGPGGTVALSPKAAELLRRLAASPGDLVTKDQLLDDVWETRHVSEDVIKGTVRQLRKALNDDAKEPRYIQTVQGRGYRLIATVQPVATDRPFARRANFGWAALVAVIGLALGIIFFLRTADPPDALAARPCLAVLPLANLTGDEDQAYRAQAMTESLIGDLSRVAQFRVISHSSVRSWADQPVTMSTLVEELGVDYVVEGALSALPDGWRITLRLVDATSEEPLFSLEERASADTFLQLEETTRRRLAGEIRDRFDVAAATGATPPLDAATHDLFLRARFLLTGDDRAGAIALLEDVVEKAPEHAEAWAALSVGHFRQVDHGGSGTEAYAAARDAATQALRLDPNSPDALASMGGVHFAFDWDFPAAEEALRRAVQINPSHVQARELYSCYLSAMGRPEEALAEAREVARLNPRAYSSPVVANLLYNAGRLDEARQEIDKVAALSEQPEVFYAQARIASAQEDHRATVDALLAMLQAARAPASVPERIQTAWEEGGRDAVARELIELSVAQFMTGQPTLTTDIAGLCVLLGEVESAYMWLDRAVERREIRVPFLRILHEFRPLHGEQRFEELLARVGLPPTNAASSL